MEQSAVLTKTLTWKGQPVFVATTFAEDAGYKQGRRLADSVTGRWANEFNKEEDYFSLSPEDIPLFALENTIAVDAKTRHLLLLTMEGAIKTLFKIHTTKATAIRKQLEMAFMPNLKAAVESKMNEDQQIVNIPQAPLQKGKRFKKGIVRLASMHLAAQYLTQAIEKGTVDVAYAQPVLVQLFEKLTGVDFTGMRRLIRTDLTSCDALAMKHGISLAMFGKVVTWIKKTQGFDLRTDESLCERRLVKALNHEEETRDVEQYRLTKMGVEYFDTYLKDFIEAHPKSKVAEIHKLKKTPKTLESGLKTIPDKALWEKPKAITEEHNKQNGAAVLAPSVP